MKSFPPDRDFLNEPSLFWDDAASSRGRRSRIWLLGLISHIVGRGT